jgi:hypothetical protein
MVSIGETDEQLFKAVKKYGITDLEGISLQEGVQARFIQYPDGKCLIRTRSKVNNVVELARLQHEIFHAVTLILDRIGIKFCLLSSDEAYAYALQYLTQKIYEKLKIRF